MANLWSLGKLRWLAGLSPAETSELRRAAQCEKCQAGSIIFSPTERPTHVYLLESGLARVFRVSARGDEISFGYVHPGEVFGELAALGDQPRESFAQAVQASVAWKLPRAGFIQILQAHPEVIFEVARQIEGRFKRIENRVEDLALRDPYSQLARVLLQLSEEFGEPVDGGISIAIPLTQSDLATFIGATRQTVSTHFRRMVADGLISRNNDRICLLRPEQMRRQLQIGRAEAAPRS